VLSRKLEPTAGRSRLRGAGPAGLTAAFYLRCWAMRSRSMTASRKPAHACRFALPEYTPAESGAAAQIELIERLGVKFIFITRVGLDVPLNELADRFDSVFIPSGLERILGLSARARS